MEKINLNKSIIKIGVIGDTHLGSIYSPKQNILKAFEKFEKAKVDFMLHTGDVTEGMSNRPEQIYELSHVGYDEMKKYSIELLSKCPCPAYYIDGNHDQWFIKSNGALIVKDITDAIPNAKFLGHGEGDIKLNNIIIKLWHGGDGNALTTSYRMQKVVETLTQIEKFDIILMGHTHKQGYIYEREKHVISTGALQNITGWMKGKRLIAHTGFHIIELTLNNKGIESLGVTWFPIKTN